MPTVIIGPEGYLRILVGWRLYYVMMNIHVYDLGVAKGFGFDMEAKFIKQNEWSFWENTFREKRITRRYEAKDRDGVIGYQG